MSRADDLATFGRKIAAAQGVLDDRPQGDWLTYGQACQDALSRRRPVPVPLPPSAPPAPPVAVSVNRVPRFSAVAQRPVEPRRGPAGRTLRTSANAPRRGPTGTSRQAPVLCAASARPVEEEFAQRRSLLAGVVWGLTWRYGVLGALFMAAQSQAQKPWLVIAGVLLGGLLLGLWRRRWALARLWRTVVVAGGAVYVAPLFSVYPDVLVGSIGALTLAPLVATWRRR